MEITVTKQPKSTVRLTIELTPAEMQPFLEQAAEHLSHQHKIEGFRPGKASLGIVQQKLGTGPVWEEAAEHAVRKTFLAAVKQHELMTIGAPKISVHKLSAGNPFVYHADVALLPEVKLGSTESFKTKKTVTPVAEAQIEKSLEDLRGMFAKEQAVARPAAKGDKIEVDFILTVDGVAVEGGSSTNHPVTIGSGQFIPGFEDNLVGLKSGEAKKFSLQFPKEYSNATVAGKTGEFAVTAKSVMEIIKPELNDDFAKQASKFQTLAELKSHLAENLKQEAEQESERAFERAIMEEVIERSTFGDLPDLLVTSELDKMLRELKEEIEQRGMKYDDYLTSLKKSEEELKTEFKPQAIRRVKSALILRALAKSQDIMPTEAEIKAEVQTALKTYERYPELRSQIETEDYRDFVKVMLTNRKVLEHLKSKAPAAKSG